MTTTPTLETVPTPAPSSMTEPTSSAIRLRPVATPYAGTRIEIVWTASPSLDRNSAASRLLPIPGSPNSVTSTGI